MFKVILALTAFFTDEKNSVIKFNIFTFIIYTEAVKDSI